MALKFPRLFALTYSLNREYPWPWFGPTMAFLAVLGLLILIPVNVALTGYQVIATPSSSHDTVQTHWYDSFWNAPKPGSLCQPHNFTVGDTLTTDYSLFQWNLVTTNTSDPLSPFIPYSGINLDTCDVIGIAVDANAQTFAVNINAGIRCLGPELPILIRTSYTPWGGGQGSFDVNVLRLNVQNVLDLPADETGTSWSGPRTGVAAVNSILRKAAVDLSDVMMDYYGANKTVRYAFSIRAAFNYCPKTLLATQAGNCTIAYSFLYPTYFWSLELAVAERADGTITKEAYNEVVGFYQAPLSNLV